MTPPSGPDLPLLGGRWRLGTRLGAGSEGVVYEVFASTDPSSPTVPVGAAPARGLVAKLTWGGTTEVDDLVELQHANIVALRDHGTTDASHGPALGMPAAYGVADHIAWFVMERAQVLEDVIGVQHTRPPTATTPLEPAEAIRLQRDLWAALDHLEERHVVHGDIKPANVLWSTGGKTSVWRLADFGQAVEVDQDGYDTTRRGHTPAYSSPRSQALRRVTYGDDRYAAALTVHLAATGRFPVAPGDGPLQLAPSLPHELRRPLADALAAASVEASPVPPLPPPAPPTPPMPTPPRPPSPPRATKRILALVAALVVLGAAAWFLAQRGGDDDPSAGPTTTTATTATSTAGLPGSTAPTSEGEPTATTAAEGTPSASGLLGFTRRVGSASQVVVVDLASGEQQVVDVGLPEPRQPSTSDDGRTVAVVVGEDGTADLAVRQPSSTGFRILELGGRTSDPAVSPDGTQIAFTTDAAGSDDVAIYDVATGAVRSLLDGSADEGQAAWSPDGTSIALVRSTSGGDEVLVVDVAALDVRSITDPGGAKASPSWSPDGGSVALVAEASGGRDVVVVEVDAKTAVTVALTPEDEREVAWCGGALVTSATRRGLVRLALDGSTAPLTDAAGDADPSCAAVATGS